MAPPTPLRSNQAQSPHQLYAPSRLLVSAKPQLQNLPPPQFCSYIPQPNPANPSLAPLLDVHRPRKLALASLNRAQNHHHPHFTRNPKSQYLNYSSPRHQALFLHRDAHNKYLTIIEHKHQNNPPHPAAVPSRYTAAVRAKSRPVAPFALRRLNAHHTSTAKPYSPCSLCSPATRLPLTSTAR